MTFKDLQTVVDEAVDIFSREMPITELTSGRYTVMRYPKKIPLMQFAVKWYAVPCYGNLFTMYTKALGGFMQLATLVWTPNYGTDVPLLLIDVMTMGKKRAVFVEYYDLTSSNISQASLEKVAQQYAGLQAYQEKETWYVNQRTAYSLIKGGNDEDALLDMLRESVKVYARVCKAQRAVHPKNLKGLSSFVERMMLEGNPSSGTMKKVLGKEEANHFFQQVIMPVKFTQVGV